MKTEAAETEGLYSCSAVEILATLNTPRLGLFHLHFKGCIVPETAKKCETAGDEAGVILVLGSWHLVYDKLGSGADLGIGAAAVTQKSTHHMLRHY